MSDDRNLHGENERLDEQQRLAQEAVRSLPRPQASADFRARLKQQFVAGEIPETPLSNLEAPGPDFVPAPAETGIRPETQHLGRLWLGWTALATAAVVAAVVLGFNSLPGPRLVATNGVGTVTVAGRSYEATDTAGLDAALRSGARVEVGQGSQVDIVYPGSFVMRAAEGTDVILPDRPGRWFRRTVEAPMQIGEVSVRTGPDLAGGALIVRTDEGRAIIHGTLISVMRNEMATCVCLFEGTAEMMSGGRLLGDIPPGQRWVIMRDGSEPQLMDIEPTHEQHMLDMDRDCTNVFDVPSTR